MKHILIAILLLAFSLHGEEPKEKFPEFMNLDKKAAAVTARTQAEADFAAGRYRILVYGLRLIDKSAEKKDGKVRVEEKAIAGCIVSEGILEGARVYNDVMREKLKAKLGYDVFDEKADSQKQSSK